MCGHNVLHNIAHHCIIDLLCYTHHVITMCNVCVVHVRTPCILSSVYVKSV